MNIKVYKMQEDVLVDEKTTFDRCSFDTKLIIFIILLFGGVERLVVVFVDFLHFLNAQYMSHFPKSTWLFAFSMWYLNNLLILIHIFQCSMHLITDLSSFLILNLKTAFIIICLLCSKRLFLSNIICSSVKCSFFK